MTRRLIIVPAMGNRLRNLRDGKKWTAEEAANEFGLSRSGYLKLERGERRLSDERISLATRIYGVSSSEVIGDSTVEAPIERHGSPPDFAGFVQAGSFLPVEEYFQQDGFELPDYVIRQSSYGKVRQYAYRVRGDSLNLEGINDGDWIVAADYSDFIDVYGEVESGELVVVQRTRYQGSERELTVKQIRFYRDHYDLVPRSSNPEHQIVSVPHNHATSGDAVEVKLVGVLLTAYKDFRRPRR